MYPLLSVCSSCLSPSYSRVCHCRYAPLLPSLGSKTNADGSRRFLAIYSSGASQRLTIYYQTDLITPPQRVTASASVSDGQWHQLLVSFTADSVTVVVDGQTRLLAAPLVSPAVDCGVASPNCVSWLGQRASGDGSSGGSFAMAGEVLHARLYPSSGLRTHPADTAVPTTAILEGFTRQPNQYVSACCQPAARPRTRSCQT